MNKVTWVVQVLLALAFAAAGSFKLMSPRADLVANGMGWAEDFTDRQVQLIGVAEAAGAAGLVLPAASGVLRILTPAAAVGLTLLMAGAVLTHVTRGEMFVPPLVLALLSALVAYLRRGWFRAG